MMTFAIEIPNQVAFSGFLLCKSGVKGMLCCKHEQPKKDADTLLLFSVCDYLHLYKVGEENISLILQLGIKLPNQSRIFLFQLA